MTGLFRSLCVLGNLNPIRFIPAQHDLICPPLRIFALAADIKPESRARPAQQPGCNGRFRERCEQSWGVTLRPQAWNCARRQRSEEHTSELQSRGHLVCRLLLEKKKTHT